MKNTSTKTTKTALVTGASSGIGKQLAIAHAKNNGNLVIVARSTDKLDALKTELESTYNIDVLSIPMDLTAPNAAQELYDTIKQQNITIDYLINNAGFGGHGLFHQRSAHEDLAMIQLNMVTLTQLCYLFLPDFIARNSGRILNVTSTASFVPGPLQAVYFATKAYAASLSNAISGELLGTNTTNVTVTNLMPGATETEFAKEAGLEKSNLFAKAVPAKLVAEQGYNGMLSGKINVISGLTFAQRLMIFFAPFTPKKMLLKQIYNMQKI